MTNKLVFWLDEEENAAYPEIIQLKFHGCRVDYMSAVDRALDRITSSSFDTAIYSAFVFDAHMPNYGDRRFESANAIDKSLAGVRLCDILSSNFSTLWDTMKIRSIIYTMLPQSSRVDYIRRFASSNSIKFIHKTDDGQIYEYLKEWNWV